MEIGEGMSSFTHVFSIGLSAFAFFLLENTLRESWQKGVWIARMALGVISAVLLVVYLGHAARAIELGRRERKAERKVVSLTKA